MALTFDLIPLKTWKQGSDPVSYCPEPDPWFFKNGSGSRHILWWFLIIIFFRKPDPNPGKNTGSETLPENKKFVCFQTVRLRVELARHMLQADDLNFKLGNKLANISYILYIIYRINNIHRIVGRELEEQSEIIDLYEWTVLLFQSKVKVRVNDTKA